MVTKELVHADSISRRATSVFRLKCFSVLSEDKPWARHYPAWAKSWPRPTPAPLQHNESLPNWSCLTSHLLLLLWLHHERLCAVCSWECTSMDNRTAEIPWCLPPSEPIIPEPGILHVGFPKRFPESAHCIERNTLSWTKMTAVLSHPLYYKFGHYLKANFKCLEGAFNMSIFSWR